MRYILDTNAVQGISSENLARAAERFDIFISPLSFYELLSHLNEEDAEERYLRRRGIVRKARFLQILDDPIVDYARRIGIESRVNRTRFEDPDIIRQILENLENSETLAEFEACEVTFENSLHSCRNIGDQTKQALETDQREHVRYTTSAAEDVLEYLEEHGREGLEDHLGSFILSNLRSACRDMGFLEDARAMTRLGFAEYINAGYYYARILISLRAAGFQLNNYAARENDFEDSLIILSLDLNQESTLVTSDGGTIEAFEMTKRAYHRTFGDDFPMGSECITNDEFLALLD